MADYFEIANAFVRELWTPQDVNGSMELTKLLDSGLFTSSPQIRRLVNAMDMGTTLEIPFIQEALYSEPNISDDTTTEGGKQQITQKTSKALLGNYNYIFGTADVARMVDSGMDVFDAIQSLTGRYWAKDIQHRMASSLIGVLADNVANDGSDLLKDESGNAFTSKILYQTKQLRGDAGWNGNQFMFVHSAGFTAMQIAEPKRIAPVMAEDGFTVLYYLYDEQSMIVIDDIMPYDGTNATMMLADAGAFVYEESTDIIIALESERKPTQGNGGGLEDAISRKRYLVHPQGFSWTGASQAKTTGATQAELQNATNWDRTVINAKASLISFLKFKV